MYFKTLSIAVLSTLLAFSLSFPAASSLSQNSSDSGNIERLTQDSKDDIERITVYGQRNVFQLKKDIRKKRKAFYKLFNQINDNKKFHVICKNVRRSNSHFSDHVCEPRYIKTNRAKQTASNAYAGDVNINIGDGDAYTGRLNTISKVRESAYGEIDSFFGHMQDLIAKNTELSERYFEILDLTAAYEQKKENKD